MVDNMIDIINIKETCRLCLSNENEIDLNTVYKGGGIPYKRLASMIIETELLENEMFSNRICEECASKLILFYKFKQICISTNRTLIELTLNPETSTEPELDSDNDSNNDDIIKISSDEEYLLEEVLYDEESLCDLVSDNETTQNDPITDKPKFQCEECGKIFCQYFGLVQHSQQHKGQKKFECEICQKKFTRLYNVTIHMRLHNNERPYECEVCNRKFVKSGDLARHQRIHRDEKNYKCLVCSKAFKRSTDVTSHMRSHTGEKRYKCLHCIKAYSSYSGLKKHLKYHQIK